MGNFHKIKQGLHLDAYQGTISPADLVPGDFCFDGYAYYFRDGYGVQTASNYALITNSLSQFAATTSAQLAGVVSDETGSGALVFATNPSLGGATSSANITFSTNAGVESTSASSALNIGSAGNTATLNLGTGTNTNTINVGTGSGVTTINLGGAGDIVNISGTLVAVNTTTLDVYDQNFTLNKGGTDATSIGAGLTIDRVSTKGSLVYDSSLTSKFKVGDLGSEVEIVSTSTSQALTNKTISGLNNTITNISGTIPLGSVVATFPNLTGAYVCTATTVADANGFVKCNGQTIADVTSSMNGAVIPNINNSVFLQGSTTAGSTGGAASVTLGTANLPAHSHTISGTASASSISGTAAAQSWSGSVSGSNSTSGISGTAAAQSWGGSVSGGSYNVGAILQFNNGSFGSGGSQPNIVDNVIRGPTSNPSVSGSNNASSISGTANAQSWSGSVSGSNSTSGVTGTAVGQSFSTTSGNGPGTSTAFSIVPVFISTVYVMRIK